MIVNSVSEDVRSILQTNGFGVDAETLFSYEWGSETDPEVNENSEINSQVIVLDTESIDTDLKEIYEQPTFQIVVRGGKSDASPVVRAKADAIKQFLIKQSTQTINGVDYLQFEPIGGILPLGKDSNDCFVYSMNFFTFINSLDENIDTILLLIKEIGVDEYQEWVETFTDIVEQQLPDYFSP